MLALFFIFISSIFFPQLLFSSSVTGNSVYPAFCQSAADHDSVFFRFKRHPVYVNALEHVTYQQGLEYIKIIKEQYPELLKYADYYAENDAVGDPKMHYYEEIGWASATTLRYVKIVGDLIAEFGDLSNKHIVEIGGGYGGLCKILHDVTGFSSYTLIDLPECNGLSRKYLKFFNVKNVKWIDAGALNQVENYDLLISNYAFSEIDREEQISYLKAVLLPTSCGYMIYNFVSLSNGIYSYSPYDVMGLLRSYGWDVSIEEEKPATGFEKNPNLLIKWKAF